MPLLNLLRPSLVAAGPALALALVLSPALAGNALAAAPVAFGTADSFAILAGSTITNSGVSTITGDIGLCCTGVATTGFGPGANAIVQTGGAQYAGTGGVAATAQDDLDIAYLDAAGRAVTRTVEVDLSLTGTPANPLLPGVYETTAQGALEINTGLTLDFQGDPNAVFIFQGTKLVTAAGSSGSVTIVNGGASPSTCNIVWQLRDATQGVTLGTASAFKGTTMSLGASVLGTSATVEGRILTRRSKAVNLDTNTITRSPCSSANEGGGGGGTPGGDTPPGDTPAPTPTPGDTSTPTPTPGDSPAPIDLPAVSAPATVPGGAAGGAAAAAGSPTGSATLSGPSAPVTGPFDVSVTGQAIASVVFRIDGKPRPTVHAKPGRKRFKITINPMRQSHGVHRVTARVRFKPGSRSKTTTRRLVYRRASSSRPPQFTG